MATKQSYLKDEPEPEPEAKADADTSVDADSEPEQAPEPTDKELATDTTGMASQNAARNQT